MIHGTTDCCPDELTVIDKQFFEYTKFCRYFFMLLIWTSVDLTVSAHGIQAPCEAVKVKMEESPSGHNVSRAKGAQHSARCQRRRANEPASLDGSRLGIEI